MAAASARAGLARGRAELGPRLHLCLLGRRCRRRGAAPLRRGAHHRRRAGRPGRRVTGPIAGRPRSLRPESLVAPQVGCRGAGGRSDRSSRPRCAGAVGAHGVSGFAGPRCRHGPEHPRDAAGPTDRARQLVAGHHRRRGRGGDRHHLLDRPRATAQRADRPGQARCLRTHGGTARRRHPPRPAPAPHSSHRRSGVGGTGLRMAAVRSGAHRPSGRGQCAGRPGVPLQRPGVGGGRRHRWHVLPQRTGRLRPAGRRRGPGRLVQLLPSARGHHRGDPDRGGRPGDRRRPGTRPGR